MKTMLLCLAMLFPVFAVGYQEPPAVPMVVFLEPNPDAIRIENFLTARANFLDVARYLMRLAVRSVVTSGEA